LHCQRCNFISTTIKGLITGFDGLSITGWLQGANAVDLYINNFFAGSFSCSHEALHNPRPFEIDVRPFLAECLATPKIIVRFAKTDVELDVAETARELINPIDLFPESILCYFGSQCGTFVPPQEFLDYIGSGSAGKRGFLEIGVQILRDLIYFGAVNESPPGRLLILAAAVAASLRPWPPILDQVSQEFQKNSTNLAISRPEVL
jgi:hypothetical protein